MFLGQTFDTDRIISVIVDLYDLILEFCFSPPILRMQPEHVVGIDRNKTMLALTLIIDKRNTSGPRRLRHVLLNASACELAIGQPADDYRPEKRIRVSFKVLIQ
jgi:hypothetical protein